LDVPSHSFQRLRKGGQRLDTRLPWLLGDGIDQGLALQFLVSFHPLLKLNHLQRVSGSGQRLSQQWIRIESDWRNE
jgi:hypothetical protein